MFDHLDAHERIERMFELWWDIPVIKQVHTDAVFQTSVLDPLLRERLLLNGQCERIHLAVICACRLSWNVQ